MSLGCFHLLLGSELEQPLFRLLSRREKASLGLRLLCSRVLGEGLVCLAIRRLPDLAWLFNCSLFEKCVLLVRRQEDGGREVMQTEDHRLSRQLIEGEIKKPAFPFVSLAISLECMELRTRLASCRSYHQRGFLAAFL